MRGFWMLVHVLGFTLWLGGGIATMVAGVTAKRLPPDQRLAGYKLIGAVQRILVGPGALAVVLSGVILSMPYAWWKQFEASDIEVLETLDRPVDPRIVETLLRKLPEFRRAYEEDGLRPEEFVRYGSSIHTLNQFIGGYHDLLAIVRERMLR